MRICLFLLALATSLSVLASPASANSYNLFCSGTACGTATITNISGGAQVVVDMTHGYSIQAEAASGGFTFDTVTGLSLSLQGGTIFTSEFGTVGATLASGVNNGAGKFTFGVVQFAIPPGNTSVSQISFVVLGLSTSNLIPNNMGNVVSVHFCSPGAGGSQSTNCPDPTGFATASGSTSTPEPSTLGLLGTGLVGIGVVVRRKLTGSVTS